MKQEYEIGTEVIVEYFDRIANCFCEMRGTIEDYNEKGFIKKYGLKRYKVRLIDGSTWFASYTQLKLY